VEKRGRSLVWENKLPENSSAVRKLRVVLVLMGKDVK
jgi:hypothetical protein